MQKKEEASKTTSPTREEILNHTIESLQSRLTVEKYEAGTFDLLRKFENYRAEALSKKESELALKIEFEDGFVMPITVSGQELDWISVFIDAKKTEERLFHRTEVTHSLSKATRIVYCAHAIEENNPLENWDTFPKIISNMLVKHQQATQN